MKKIIGFAICFTALLYSFSSCKSNDPVDTNKYVNNWIYENMVNYYLWNDKIPLTPDYTLTPDKFFASLLYKYNKDTNPHGDRFSWIQENYVDLLNSLSGVSTDEIGFEYVFVRVKNTNTYYLLVLYPKPGTDAYSKGIKRGDFIMKINGTDITKNNYSVLLSGTGAKTLSVAKLTPNAEGKYDLSLIGDVNVQMKSNYAENPIYLDSIYTVNNKKVGYLVYNFFANDNGDDSRSYDKQLMEVLQKIKSQGATEFILDLRYNRGGTLSSAVALASALVKNRSTSNLLDSLRFNPLVHSELKKRSGADFNKDHFIDKVVNNNQQTVAAVPTSNYSTLYILVTGSTASASELVINGLKPYMDKITLIGDTTVGKNVGSISLYEKNDSRNKWGMQPIVFQYYNSQGKSDFTAGFVPDYPVDEFESLYLVNFGKTEEPLLNKALSLINGGSSGVHPRKVYISEKSYLKQKIELKKVKTDLSDDIRGEEIRKKMLER
ncbi:MAG: S41 family peptidase [Paludibacteraceae bacterium]